MEFAIGTFLTLIAIVVAYLTYRAQVDQAFKRIHYSSFMMDLILPMNDGLRSMLTFRFNGEDLINPVLCVATIQNTGTSPILPSDFDGPLTVASREKMAIIRHGLLECDPPNIFDIDHPENLKIKVVRNKFMLGPTLMNPKDRITLFYIADMIPDDWELEVTSRIAGVEKIVRLPRLEKGISHTFNVQPLRGVRGRNTPMDPAPGQLMLVVWTAPVFATPEGRFKDLLDVTIDGVAIEDPHTFLIAISNGKEGPSHYDSDSEILFEFPDTRIIRVLTEFTGTSLAGIDLSRQVHLEGHRKLLVRPPLLSKGEAFKACAITSGECGAPIVSCKGFTPDQAMFMQLTVDGLIDANLAKIDPQLLLSNQRAYALWQELSKKYRWLARRENRS